MSRTRAFLIVQLPGSASQRQAWAGRPLHSLENTLEIQTQFIISGYDYYHLMVDRLSYNHMAGCIAKWGPMLCAEEDNLISTAS